MSRSRTLNWLGQAVAYGLFAAMLGALSAWPSGPLVEPGRALVKLSFTHAGAHIEECRELTPAEVARLAPNMRVARDCVRGRVPIIAELIIDGKTVHTGVYEPTGLWGDGPSVVYEKFWVPAGDHRIKFQIRASRRESGFDYSESVRVSLAEHQILVVDFHSNQNGIVFH